MCGAQRRIGQMNKTRKFDEKRSLPRSAVLTREAIQALYVGSNIISVLTNNKAFANARGGVFCRALSRADVWPARVPTGENPRGSWLSSNRAGPSVERDAGVPGGGAGNRTRSLARTNR